MSDKTDETRKAEEADAASADAEADLPVPPDFDDDADPMRALLRKSAKAPLPEAPASVLPAVQRKLRERSRGKFYGDGWSTAHQTTSYLLVAAMMLIVLGVAYYTLASVR